MATPAELAAMDARLDKGQDWLREEFWWLREEYAAGRNESAEWKERAVRYVTQYARWELLFVEYVAARDALTGAVTPAAQSEAERQWAALA